MKKKLINLKKTIHLLTVVFNFAKSLTVKGGILTVADDLLKNEGKKILRDDGKIGGKTWSNI